MTEKCPICGAGLLEDSHPAWKQWRCLSCEVTLTWPQIELARVTRDAAIAEAVRPWREALERTTDAVDEHRLIGVANSDTRALIESNRALLDKAGA